MNAYSMAPPQALSKRRRAQIGVVAYAFILIEIICNLALLVPKLAPLRVVWRMGSFLLSLALLGLFRGRTRRFPGSVPALWVMAIAGLSVFHPTTNGWTSGLAQFASYVAVLAPLFWVARMRLDMRAFRRIIFALWAYYTASTSVGLLQVFFPGSFEMPLSPFFISKGPLAEAMKITLANGKEIYRPMGLTDMPGGASTCGLWAILFGLGFLMTARTVSRRLWCAAGIGAGLFCIYLSQIRAAMVVVVIWAVAIAVILFTRRMFKYLTVLLVGAGLVFVLSLGVARRIGGVSAEKRVATLTAGQGKAKNLYAADREIFLRRTFNDILPRYPLGAGMGRWGMMNKYFPGANDDPERAPIYVEIQWTGWILDGGVPMVLAYMACVLATMFSLVRIMRKGGPMWLWAALVVAYDIGTIAICFDYTPFVGESGIEFWFLNALVLTTAACLPDTGAGGFGAGADGGRR